MVICRTCTAAAGAHALTAYVSAVSFARTPVQRIHIQGEWERMEGVMVKDEEGGGDEQWDAA